MVEHPDQEKYESYTLTIDEWKQVIAKAQNANASALHMYILRSWANQQVVTNGSLNAFRENVIEDVTDRSVGSTAIGTISGFVRAVTGNDKATCYEWNTIKGEWSIGTYQAFSLRMALGHTRAPKGSGGVK
tara:strand:+ start:227 stop:619 length:393 start_codon:yes stop_codon:yes gene_type:complete